MTVADLLAQLPLDQRESYGPLIREWLRDLAVQVPQRHRREVMQHADRLVDLLTAEGYEPWLVAELVCEHLYGLGDLPGDPTDCGAHWRDRDDEPANSYVANVREWYADGDQLIAYAQSLADAESWVLATTLDETDRAREALLVAGFDIDAEQSPATPEPVGSSIQSNAPPATAVRGATARRLLREVGTATA